MEHASKIHAVCCVSHTFDCRIHASCHGVPAGCSASMALLCAHAATSGRKKLPLRASDLRIAGYALELDKLALFHLVRDSLSHTQHCFHLETVYGAFASL